MGNALAARHRQSDALHHLLEAIAVFGLLDGVHFCADQFHVVTLENAAFRQRDGEVQRSLTTHGRQQCLRPFPCNNLFQHVWRQRFQVGAVSDLRIRHDGGWVVVHQHNSVALLL